MKRDPDLVRDILVQIEDGWEYFSTTSDETAAILGTENEESLSEEEAERIDYHMHLLVGAGFIETQGTGDGWIVNRITWAGHDFLDSVRDDEVWSQTKAGVKHAGGFTIDLAKELAKGLIRKKIEDHTGVSL